MSVTKVNQSQQHDGSLKLQPTNTWFEELSVFWSGVRVAACSLLRGRVFVLAIAMLSRVEVGQSRLAAPPTFLDCAPDVVNACDEIHR